MQRLDTGHVLDATSRGFQMTDTLSAPAASEPVKLWCETCEGGGYVFQEPQAGCHVWGNCPCPDCDGKGYWFASQPPAASQPSGPVQRWHDRIKAAHPNSDPAYWPLSLKAGYMEDEIIELRVALAATQPPAASQPSADLIQIAAVQEKR